MQQLFLIICILFGIILYKLLNLKEGLNIGGWVRYYFVKSDGTNTLVGDEPDEYDPLTPSPAPDDGEQLLIIYGSGRIPTQRGLRQEFDAEIDRILENNTFAATDQPIVVPIVHGCQLISTEQADDSIDEHIRPINLRQSPGYEVSQLSNTLLLAFYTPYNIGVNSNRQSHMGRPIHPDSFHMAYIDSSGHYIGDRRTKRVADMMVSVDRWFNQIFRATSQMDDFGEQEGYNYPEFSELLLGNMKSYDFQTSFGFLSFFRGRSQSIDRCMEFIEYVRTELYHNNVDVNDFNLTIHIYYDRFTHDGIFELREFPANILVYTFQNTNLNQLLNNLFLINILFNEDDVTHTDNPLSDACASGRRFDP